LDNARPEPAASANNYKQFAILLIGFTLFGIGPIGLYKPILAPYLKSAGFAGTAIGFTIGLMGLSKSICNIPAGALSDKYGRKPVLVIGMLLLSVCYPFYLMGKNIVLLAVARVFQGAGNSVAAQPAMTAVADLLGKKRAFGMGMMESCSYFAVSGFALLAGSIATSYGMLAPFYIGMPITLAGALFLYLFLKESRPVVAEAAAPSPDQAPGALAECKSPAEVWKKLLANPGFASMCYLGFMTKLTDEGILVTLIPLVAALMGFKVAAIASFMAIGYLTFALIQPLTGWISDHIGRKPMFVLGLGLLTGAALMFPFATSYSVFVAAIIVLKIGNALLYPSLPAAAADMSPDRFRGTGLSAYRFFRDAGVFGGPVIAGIALDALGKINAFYFVAGLFLLGLLLTVATFKETVRKV
jgi:MFS family permease